VRRLQPADSGPILVPSGQQEVALRMSQMCAMRASTARQVLDSPWQPLLSNRLLQVSLPLLPLLPLQHPPPPPSDRHVHSMPHFTQADQLHDQHRFVSLSCNKTIFDIDPACRQHFTFQPRFRFTTRSIASHCFN
jgi:hypothetical protein